MAATEFSGTYYCTLDAKNRLNIPADIRKKLSPEAENTLVFTIGFEKSLLYAYPLNEWNRLTKIMRDNSPLYKEMQQFIRMFVGNAYDAHMDNQGRIMIPERILKLGNIEKELAFVGALEKLEVWNPTILNEHLDKLSIVSLAEQINLPEMFGARKSQKESQVG